MYMVFIHGHSLRKRILLSALDSGGGDICVTIDQSTYVTNIYWVSIMCSEHSITRQEMN